MKKTIFYCFLALVVLGLFVNMCKGNSESDSSKSSTNEKVQNVVNEPEQISESELREMVSSRDYKKACEVKEFGTAYEIVDKLKEETTEAKANWKGEQGFMASKGTRERYEVEYEAAMKKSTEAERYVVLQEALFVLESEDTNSLVRLVGIAKEHDAEDWLYLELIDIEKKVGNLELVDKLEHIRNN